MNILSSIRALYTGPNAPFTNESPKPLYNHEKPWEEDGSSDDNAGQPQVTHEITLAQGFQNRVVSIVDGLGRQIEKITNVIGRLASMLKQIAEYEITFEYTLRERCALYILNCAFLCDGIKEVIGNKIASIFMDQKVSKISTANSVVDYDDDNLDNIEVLLAK
jgi:hypothetical protein